MLTMIHWLRKRLRRKPILLYLLTILLYVLVQSLHPVILPTLENPFIMGANVKANLRDLSNSLYGDHNSRSAPTSSNPAELQHLAGDQALSIKDLAEDLQEELRAVHRELMQVLRSPLMSNKTEAHNLNAQVLHLIKKVTKSAEKPQSERDRLGVLVEVKDAVYREMKLIRKLAPAAKPGAAVLQVKVPLPWRALDYKKPQPQAVEEKVKHCLKLSFADPPMAVTALVSFPGSGNTWLRHLIQEATGLMTGSLHPDPYLMSSGFPGEKTSDGKVVVVKVHSQPYTLRGCTRAVVLLRNPYRSLLADYNRHNRISSNEHTGHAPDSLFKEPEWDRRANTLGADWYVFYDGWLELKKPLLVLSYEDLKINPKYHVKRIVQFLGLNIPERNYECMLNNTEGSYHRRPKQVEVNLFNKKQIGLVNLYADMINDKVRKYNITVDTTVPQ